MLDTIDTILNELISLRTKEIVVDSSVNDDVLNQIKNLKILISEQNDTEDSSEVSFASQDVENSVEVEVIKHLITYLKITQKRALSHLQRAVHYEPSQYLKMDYHAKRNLELLRNLRTQKKSGTLLWLLDSTKTAMGGRLVKQCIERHLINLKEIEARQSMVENLLTHYFERSGLQEELVNVYDLERLAGKVAFGSVNGRDLIQLRTS